MFYNATFKNKRTFLWELEKEYNPMMFLNQQT